MKIINGTIIINGQYEKHELCIHEDRISAFSTDSETLDASGLFLVPGFVDIHTHGFRGYSSEGNPPDLLELLKAYASRGVLWACPTIGPRSFEEYLQTIESYKKILPAAEAWGAHFCGLHLEGPYLNQKRCGAIDPNKIREIDIKALEDFLVEAQGYVKIMTIAPELANGLEAINLLKKYNVIPSIGHSDASFEETEKAISDGISHSTHTFNAMPPLHHRKPMMLDSLLTNAGVYCEMIADSVHLSDLAKELLIYKKGTDKVMAVSDGGESCGFEYEDGFEIEEGYLIKNNAVFSKAGTLCGSCIDLSRSAVMLSAKYPPEKITRLFSENAARSMGIDISLTLGNKASFLLVDEQYSIKYIFKNGKQI